MRVGYVVERYPCYSETFIVNEILAHETAGLDVRIFSLLPPLDTHFHDVIAQVRAPVQYLPSHAGRASDWWAGLAATARVYPAVWETLATATGDSAREVLQALVLAQEIHSLGITHLHAHFASAATTVARLAAGICDIPYSFTAHAKDIFPESVAPATLTTMVSDAAVAVAVSDVILDYLNTRCGRQTGQIARIYNGLELTRFSYSDPAARPGGIVAVGQLMEKKGVACLIEACRLLARRGRSFHCRIIGSGDLEQELRYSIAASGLEAHVELLDSQPLSLVMHAIRAAAVFAAPCIVSKDGNCGAPPAVLLESMALGTPCVTTDVPGITEILRDGETGLQVTQDDPAALAAALERLLVDPSLRVGLARRARALVEAEFDVHRNSARLRASFTDSDAVNLNIAAGAA